MESDDAGDKFWIEGHGKSRTEIEAECLIIPCCVGQVFRQQSRIHLSERPEGAYSRCHCPSGAIIDNPGPAWKTPRLLQSMGCTSSSCS